MRRQELDAIRQQTEREAAERLHLEDAILEKTMASMTLNKAADYSKKILRKLREDETRRVSRNFTNYFEASFLNVESIRHDLQHT